MKPTTRVAQITGDLGGQKIDMGIDTSAMVHIMSILTDLYSDPAMAVIREYSTNALDSHIESGNSDPIEVTLPTALRPHFTVQDYGMGLSVDEISEIYSQYGASTKRGTNDLTGMLGLGCKSGLTYAAQFSVNAVKNGVKTHVVVARREDGAGVMEVVDTRSTTERNGVLVSIPVSHHNPFVEKAEEFFRFWPAGSVRINGKVNEGHTLERITDSVFVESASRYNLHDYVIMGNVAYPVPDRHWFPDVYGRTLSIIAFVGMGEVDITPSREALMMTNKTKARLAKIEREYADSIFAAAQAEIDAAVTARHAFILRGKWQDRVDDLGRKVADSWRPTWNNQQIPKEISLGLPGSRKVRFLSMGTQRGGLDSQVTIHANRLGKMAFIHGFPETSDVNGGQKRKMRVWAANLGVKDDGEWRYKSGIVITDDQIDNYWLNGKVGVSWEIVRKTKVETSGTGYSNRTVTAGTQRVFTGYETNYYGRNRKLASTRIQNADLIGKTLYYCEADYIENLAVAPMNNSDEYIVLVHETRQKAFLRNFPQAQPYAKYRKEQIASIGSTLTDDEKLWLMGYRVWDAYNKVRSLDPARIDDPDVSNLCRVMKHVHGNNNANIRDYDQKHRQFATRSGEPKFDLVNPLENYPLLPYDSSKIQEDVYLYLNTKYAYRKDAQ